MGAQHVRTREAITASERRRAAAFGKACECSDHACPVHPGRDCGRIGRGVQRHTRVDMEGAVRFCPECFDDAMETGLFE